jgi:hypothetical protein
MAVGCVDCGESWSGPVAFLLATQHVEDAGHRVVGASFRAYEYRPSRPVE